MRRFLYISPHFPPVARVGALRPLKFCRHFSDFGWQPVVLSDTPPNSRYDSALLDALPDSVIVSATFRGDGTYPQNSKTGQAAPTYKQKIGWFSGRHWLPMGEEIFHTQHALRSGRQLIDTYRCEAIVVNADPLAGLVIGRLLAQEYRLPLIADLRDPWSLCELRRPLRPFYTRYIEQWQERKLIQHSNRIVLNTETATEEYRRHYQTIPPERFTTIRNHCDPDLISSGAGATVPLLDRFSLLLLGSFSRFVRPDALLMLLAELRSRGVDSATLQLVLTEPLDRQGMQLAEKLGVTQMLNIIPPVHYTDVAATLNEADLLVMHSASSQRLQAKLYDYLFSQRPILAIAEHHPELDSILKATGSGYRYAPDEITTMADYVLTQLRQGRHPHQERATDSLNGFHTRTATKELSALLDAAVNGE